MKTWKVILAIVSATALTAVAQPRGPGGPGDRGPNDADRGMPRGVNLTRLVKNDRMLNSLNLSEAQVEALKARAASSEEKIEGLRKAIASAEADVRELMRADNPDRGAVMKAVEKAGQSHTDLRKAQIEDQFAVSEIIGAEAARELREKQQRQQMERRSDRENRRDGDQRQNRGDRRGPRMNQSGE